MPVYFRSTQPPMQSERNLSLYLLTPLQELSSCCDYLFAPRAKVNISSGPMSKRTPLTLRSRLVRRSQ